VESSTRFMARSFGLLLLSYRCCGGPRLRQVGLGPIGGLIGALTLTACSVDSSPLFDDVGALTPVAGRPGNPRSYVPMPNGSGGTGGVGGVAQPQTALDGGLMDAAVPGQADAAVVDAGVACEQALDCDDGNPCTQEQCSAGFCRSTTAAAGSACGNATEDECTLADSCDGAGRCLPNDVPVDTACGRSSNLCAADTCDGAGACVPRALAAGTACGESSGCGQPACSTEGECVADNDPNGSACPGGSCSVGVCILGQRVGCPLEVVTSVPFETNWNSAGRPDLYRGSCQNAGTPDYSVLFTAPSAGRFRFDASGSPDSVLTLTSGACSASNAAQLQPCNDDVGNGNGNGNRDSRVELTLTLGQVLTVYVSEFDAGDSGSGTLRITAL
jgi:hypothetical protein